MYKAESGPYPRPTEYSSSTRSRSTRHSIANAHQGHPTSQSLDRALPAVYETAAASTNAEAATALQSTTQPAQKMARGPSPVPQLGFTRKPKRTTAVKRPAIARNNRLAHLLHVFPLRCAAYASVKSFSVSSYVICIAGYSSKKHSIAQIKILLVLARSYLLETSRSWLITPSSKQKPRSSERGFRSY